MRAYIVTVFSFVVNVRKINTFILRYCCPWKLTFLNTRKAEKPSASETQLPKPPLWRRMSRYFSHKYKYMLKAYLCYPKNIASLSDRDSEESLLKSFVLVLKGLSVLCLLQEVQRRSTQSSWSRARENSQIFYVVFIWVLEKFHHRNSYS